MNPGPGPSNWGDVPKLDVFGWAVLVVVVVVVVVLLMVIL
jgi:hypothetical protein